MALNYKTLATRSISAAVFVVLLVGSVLWNYSSFSLFFFAVSIIALNEFYTIAQKLHAKPYRIIGLIFGSLLYLSALNFKLIFSGESTFFFANTFRVQFLLVLLAFFFFLAIPVFKRNDNSIRDISFTFFGIIYTVFPFIALNFLAQTNGFNVNNFGGFNPKLILGIIFLIWSNDTFAYLGGSLFGKNKMIERISPGKTWEGTIIGIVITFGVSFLISTFLIKSELLPWLWPLLGIIVPILATIGDLVESMLKRQAGVKDSGKIMPGHGGILDRFDSLLFVAPIVYILLSLFSV